MQSINLIPQQEVLEQTKEKAVRFSTWFSVAVLVILGGIAGFYIYQTQTIKEQIKGLDGEIAGFRGEISKLAQVEVSARNLDKKYATLKDIYANRSLYSLLSTEVVARRPEGIVIDSITLQKGSTVNITGHADNYISIALFTNNLVSTQYDKGDPLLKTLFTTVTLNSVSLEKSRNIVRFSINVDLSLDLLKEKISGHTKD